MFRFVLILALAFCPSRCLHAQKTNVEDGILAVVNDTVITRYQVWKHVQPALEALQREYASQPEAVLNQKLNALINDGLETLVDRQLILHEFTADGYRMPESYLDELVQDHIRDDFGGDRTILMKTLQAQGETLEQYRKSIRDQTIEDFMHSKNVAQEIVVSPYKIETYYQAHQDEFKVGDEVKLRMIALNKTSPDDTNTLSMAREIREKVRAGASFAEMATIYSQDAFRSQGGERGWIGHSVLRKKLADAAFALQPGQISDVIDLPNACYLMLVEQRRAAHVKPLKDVRDEIEKTLRVQEQARLQKEWIARLKAKNFILYF